MYSKAEIRDIIKEKKKKITSEELAIKSSDICNKLAKHKRFQEAGTIVSYWPLEKEVDVSFLNNNYRNNKTILLPVIAGNEIILRQFVSENMLRIGELGIKGPDGEEFTNFEKIDIVIVPGIAFDIKGNRLGRGKGYYDRFLRKLSAFKIGTCFGFQLFEKIPVNKYDTSVDEVISELTA